MDSVSTLFLTYFPIELDHESKKRDLDLQSRVMWSTVKMLQCQSNEHYAVYIKIKAQQQADKRYSLFGLWSNIRVHWSAFVLFRLQSEFIHLI